MVGRQGKVGRLLHFNLLKVVGIANNTVTTRCSSHETTTIRLTVVGVFQQDADDLYTEPFLQLLVADVFTQDRVDLNDTLPHTDVARHAAVLRNPMGAENRKQGFLAEKPAFGNL
jgi:hypothetical protein